MPKYGEVAPVSFNPDICDHAIRSDARKCDCGMRIALVVGPLQLAFFEMRRKLNPLQPNCSREANDGVILDSS